MKRLLFILALVCAPTYAQTNTARMLSGTNVVTACPYTIQGTDQIKLLVFKSSSACTVTLPTATSLNFGAGAMFSVVNQGAGTVTITPTTGTIGGNANLGLVTGQGADIYSDGANYQVQPGSGTGGGGGSPPAGSNGDTQCKNSLLFAACVQNPAVLYVSTTGNDLNSGKTWDTAKNTIMAAVCALPGGNCGTTPKQAGGGTIYFTTGVSCNSNTNAGCWIAGNGDSQYPNMTSAQGGPTAWTTQDIHASEALNFICAANETTIPVTNKPTCTVMGPNHTVSFGNLPIVWTTGGLGAIYINGLSGGQFAGGQYSASWGRIGIDSATGQISGTPTVTQPASLTVENVVSGNSSGGGTTGTGPQLALGNGFWMHFHDDAFSNNITEACKVSSISRTSNVTTVTTTSCGSGSSCPFLVGDHLSIRDTTGDGTFNGSFTAATACSGGSTVTFNQTGPNFSSSVGSNGVISDDRSFGIVCYSCQVEMARMHIEGGLKFYSGPSSNLQFEDNYIEGFGVLTNPLIWISPLLYGAGGIVDLSGQLMADAPTLETMINEGGPTVILRNSISQSTYSKGPAIFLGGSSDATNRTAGFLTQGASGWYNNSKFEADTDISRRQAPVTANIFTNLAPQNPASWTGSSFTTASGKNDPFGGSGAIEIDASAGTNAYIYNVSQTVNVGDTWYFGGWARAASGFQVGGVPFTWYIGTGNTCVQGNVTQPSIPFAGDTNWFWVSGYCTVWSTSGSAAVALAVQLNASTPVQVYRPFVFKIPSGTYTATEIAEEINSLGFGPSTQAGAGDIVFPADKKLCLPSGSATNEFCGYLSQSNTANRTYTLPDMSGTVALESGVGTVTGQVLTANNASPASFASPGLLDGNGGSAVTSTPYSIQCDSSTTILDRAHILRFQSGAAAVTVPLSTATGCAAGFVVTLVDESAGALTVSRTSADTFSIYDGGGVTTGATSFILTNGQSATLNQGATGIWEVRISRKGMGAVFNFLNYGAVDDDSTDNCSGGTNAVSAFTTAVNAYSGPGLPIALIPMGSGQKAYKLATSSCTFAFTRSLGVSVVLLGNIDCAQTAVSCIQFGATGQSSIIAGSLYNLSGTGALYGGANLTTAGVYFEPGVDIINVTGITLRGPQGGTTNGGFGANNSTLGNCTNYGIFVDTPMGTGTISGTTIGVTAGSSTSGGCGIGNPAGSSTGSNTLVITGNTIASSGNVGGSGQCGSTGVVDGGSYGTIRDNSIYGFGVDIRVQGVGHVVNGNDLDAAGCSNHGTSSTIQFGAAGSSAAVSGVTISDNKAQIVSGHSGSLFAQAGDSTATVQSVSIIGNQNITGAGINATGALVGSTFSCSGLSTANIPCYIAGNQNFFGLSGPTGSTQTGWFQGISLAGSNFADTQTANVGSTLLINAPAAQTYLATCKIVLERAATTSSTLPQCVISWTDQGTSVTQTVTVTPTWASGTVGCSGGTTNTVGNACYGTVVISSTSGGAINFSTTGYASTGATTMQYLVATKLLTTF